MILILLYRNHKSLKGARSSSGMALVSEQGVILFPSLSSVLKTLGWVSPRSVLSQTILAIVTFLMASSWSNLNLV